MLVDSHCHLDFSQLSEQIDQVMERAKAHDVAYMQTICTKVTEFDTILAIAKNYPNVWCSVGVHPNNVAEEPMTSVEELVTHAANDEVIGIGETGLDYYYDHCPKAQQQESFAIHIEAAQELQLPVIVHTRDADDDTISMLQKAMAKQSFPGLIHCFSTSHRLAEAAIEMGMYVSISGIVTFKKATQLQESVKQLPLSSLLVETDAPYLAPVPHRGKTNEPAFTQLTAQYIAELKGVSYIEVARVTTENFFTCFSKADYP